MIVRKIELDDTIEVKDFFKIISFISQDILKCTVSDNELVLEMSDDAQVEHILSRIEEYKEKFVSINSEKTYFENYNQLDYYNVQGMSGVKNLGEGMLGLSDGALKIYHYFERKFRNIAFKAHDNCEERIYPVMLPVSEYKRTGYLRNSPQYAIFCCAVHENLEELCRIDNEIEDERIFNYVNKPQYALSPSACFHAYLENKGKTLEDECLLTFTQNVFRNEGRFNYAEFGRMKDYHVREIVMFGTQSFVSKKRKSIMDMTCELVEKLNLSGHICGAADAFIIPRLQKYKKIQKMEESKYELRLNYTDKDYLSVASFNIHGAAFTYPFDIKIKDIREPVTGCVGFGLERWVLAFLSQYGENEECWPKEIKEELDNE